MLMIKTLIFRIFSSMELTIYILAIFVDFILFIALVLNIVLTLYWMLLTYRTKRSVHLGRYDKGIVAAKQALKLSQSHFFGILEKNYGLFGIFEKNKSLGLEACSLNNLAELYSYQGRYSEAEPLYKKAIEISKI